MDKSKEVQILLVEDNPGDAKLTLEAIKDGKILNKTYHVPDGEKALAFLRKEGEYSDVPRPDMILLDLNLPGKDGREVLKEVKTDDNLKRIPVIILTSSESEEDILKTYNEHANCYIRKPVDLSQFYKVVKTIEDFWFQMVVLPEK